MRRLLVGMVVLAATTLAPLWAMAGNQEVAEKIAGNLRQSGQLHGYKIGVKFQDGTAWLRGQVSTHEQMNTALKLVFQTPGVTRVVNNLTVAGESPNTTPTTVTNTTVAFNPTTAPKADLKAEPKEEAKVEPQTSPRLPLSLALKQAAGAMAPEKLSRAPQAHDQKAALAAAYRPAPAPAPAVNQVSLETPNVEPVPALAQPSIAQATPAPIIQSQPIPIAYTQPVPTAEAPMPQPAPAPVPQAAPQVMPQPAPAATPYANGAPVPIGQQPGAPIPQYAAPMGAGMMPPAYDQPHLPNYAWPSYAAYPNYAALTYPKQYSPTAWPYIGPFYPYPQVPLGWRKVTLEWHDGWWNLDFDDGSSKGWFSGLFRPCGR